MKKLLFFLLAVSLFSCHGGQTAGPSAEGDTVAFKYARLLTVVRYDDGYTMATVKNPWKAGHDLHRYVLVPADQPLPAHLPEGTVVRTPLRRSMLFTTVHCAMLMEFGREDCLAGVADLKYIKVPWIQQQVASGRLANVGDGLSPVVEKIIDARPDAILLSPFENSGGYGKLEELGIPLVECAEYMEPSPLGRAEWLRFYGMLYGCEARADSIFSTVDSSYHALTATVRGLEKPKVLVDKVTGSVWYVPGGRSTIGQMIRDAGGDYPWATDDHSGSVSLPFEAVLEKAGEADVWLFRYSGSHDITYSELASEHHGYSQLKPYRSHKAYGCDVERSMFYEESPFHPERLLGDFITILHPGVAGSRPLRYYKPVATDGAAESYPKK